MVAAVSCSSSRVASWIGKNRPNSGMIDKKAANLLDLSFYTPLLFNRAFFLPIAMNIIKF